MDVVAAADSDGRGLAFLKVVDVFKSIFTYILSFFKPSGQPVESGECAAEEEGPSISEKLSEHSEGESGEGENLSEGEVPEDIVGNSSSEFENVMPAISEADTIKKINELTSNLVLSNEILREVCARLDKELDGGLSKTTHKEAKVKCFPTYVRELPNGKEQGRFLALDLGGTNFRVLLIELDEGKFSMDSKIFAVPQDIMLGTGTGLFDHIAACLASFIDKRKLNNELLPLGFTFSFPCSQEGLTKARLTQWTKGFKCTGVEGNDVVEMLNEAIDRRGDVRIKICAVLNDTTGTGSNACYMEKLDKVELYDGEKDEKGGQVVVNTEWGAFGDNGCLDIVITEHDDALDRESLNPGRQLFEKMISGMYMGEIVRHVLVQLVKEGLLFGGASSELLNKKGSFFTKYVSEIEEQSMADTSKTFEILEELGLDDATEADCRNVRLVCERVSRRAAHLAAAGCAVLINRIKEDKVTVAIDGSVYRYHPHFHRLMVEKISELAFSGSKFELMLSEDGSGRGAALVAAVASRKAGLES